MFAGLGIHPDRYYWMSDIYPTGAMDPYIRLALDRAALVREIYRRVANVQHPDTWHPLGVICPTCGKVGTTIVTEWDGERVFFECRADLVEWAHGCGTSGWISPFGGTAKLRWNLEWAAQWSLFGVTIEPGGKDLSTAGGSRDRTDAIAREVFEREPPLNVPYEFLNIGGKKMSTSKGRGAAAHPIAEVDPARATALPVPAPAPEPGDRVRSGRDRRRSRACSTSSTGSRRRPPAARSRARSPPGYEATFRYSLLDPAADVAAEAAAFRPAFAHLALLVQIPGVDVAARVEAEKGSALTDRERAILAERVAAARAWLETYAPDRARLAVRHDAVPDEVAHARARPTWLPARSRRRRRGDAGDWRRRVAGR